MKEQLSKKISKFIRIIRNAPNKKHHLDFLAAVLTIPVLLTVIVLNFNSLQKLKTTTQSSPTPTPVQSGKQPSYTVIPSQQTNPTPTNSPSCIKTVGPIDVTYPKEGETVSDNPLCLIISYSNPNYCSVVWSYRINNGSWSDYTSNNPCIYNLPNGNVKFDLNVQSTVVQSQTTTLTRNFIYQGQTITPSPSPTGTMSASLSQ